MTDQTSKDQNLIAFFLKFKNQTLNGWWIILVLLVMGGLLSCATVKLELHAQATPTIKSADVIHWRSDNGNFLVPHIRRS
jgi:hypothetical protein